jgi:hypothetical protein
MHTNICNIAAQAPLKRACVQASLMVLLSAVPLFAQQSSPKLTIINEGQWQNTPSVVIDRSDPNTIAVAAFDDYADNQHIGMPVYLTDDGGATWNTQRLPRIVGWDPLGYPSIACDDKGRFYCAYAILNWTSGSACTLVTVSSDGVRWKNAPPIGDTTGGGFGDWEIGASLTVDNSPQSPHYGRVYVAWTHADTSAIKSGLRLIWSDDQAKSWSAPIEIASGWGGLHVQTGKNGEIFVSRTSVDGSAGLHSLAVSEDGGNTFTWHPIASALNYPYYKHPPFYDSVPGLKGGGGFMTDVSVSFSIDRRSNTVNAVYGTWDSLHGCAALYARSSADLGVTWSDSIQIGGAASPPLKGPPYPYTDRFFPWLSYDDVAHESSLIYYSSELDSNNVGTTVFRRTIGETGWSGAQELNPNPFDPLGCSANLQTTIGDYIGCDEFSGVFAAAWTKDRAGPIIISGTTTGRSDIMIYVTSPNSAVSMPVKINTDRLWLSDPFPNPLTSTSASIDVAIPTRSTARLDLFDETGRCVKTFWQREMSEGSYVLPIDMTGIPNGEYFLRLNTPEGVAVKKIVVAL